jgi:CRP-like cAMP-binding protein
MKALQDMKEQYLRELAHHQDMVDMFRYKLETIEQAISAVSGTPIVKLKDTATPRRRRNIKRFVMDFIVKQGDTGVIAQEIVAAGISAGLDIQQASVSSLLSRLKAENTLRYDGDRYYPKNVSPPDQMSLPKLAAVGRAA